MAAARKRVSERRAEHLLSEFFAAQGWDMRRPPQGDVLLQQEYKSFPHLFNIFKTASKTGEGPGLPEAILIDRETVAPLAVIETKAAVEDFDKAIKEATQDYGNPCVREGFNIVAIGLAGTSEDNFKLQVFKWAKSQWKVITYDGNPINWIPNPSDLRKIAIPGGPSELRPTIPSPAVLAKRADEINRLLRESAIKDEFRPAILGAIMLALWRSGGDIRKDKNFILQDINKSCEQAFWKANKPHLAESLKIPEANKKLAVKVRGIVRILERLNITVLTAEHDYLGQLYETFFRYTGGNTIGQYFTPRHITAFMADLCEVGPKDIVLDPACGTGGFLISAMSRVLNAKKISRTQLIKHVQKKLIGFEDEPVTAALCVANMILRGDGSTGIRRGDCFTSQDYPIGKATVVLMNPPFPHKKTDTPVQNFIDRALDGLQLRGVLACIVPYSLLVRKTKWHELILANNSLLAVFTLPPDLFVPYASSNTAIILIQKGTPHKKKSVFFARVVNDGYTVKKKTRIPRKGSQIPLILNVFQRKKNVPKMSIYSSISLESPEWSPEAYIHNAPPKDDDLIIGFEKSMRKQAAFYIHKGYKIFQQLEKGIGIPAVQNIFSNKSNLSLNNINFNSIKISDYFEVDLGGKDEVEDLEDGVYPMVTTSEFMNGITAWKNPNTVFHPPAITVATDGSTCSSFVQEYPFYAFYKVAILKPRPAEKIPTDALYFMAYIISRERWRYVYARKFWKTRISQTYLNVPFSKGQPDFKCMANLTKTTAAFPIIKAFRNIYQGIKK